MKTFYFGSDNPVERMRHWLSSPPPAIAIDVETPSLVDRTPLGFSVAFSPYEAVYFDIRDGDLGGLDKIVPLFRDPSIVKVAHNWLFDMRTMPLIEGVGEELDRYNLWDTNVCARILGHKETALFMLAPFVGMEATPASSMMKGSKTMEAVPVDELAKKCQNDARVSYALYLEQRRTMEAKGMMGYFQIEMRAIPILIDMGVRGVKIDKEALKEYSRNLDIQVASAAALVKSFGIENPNSRDQIGYTLAKRGNFLPQKRNRSTGKVTVSTRKEALQWLEDPLAQTVLQYRHLAKLKSSYFDPLLGEDYFYTEYYFDTDVGRTNSRNRNIQNFPMEARHVLLPNSGIWTTGDFSQEHLYILKERSGDRKMKMVYDEGYLGGDIHMFLAKEANIPRKLAKTINYSIVYGATWRTISEKAMIRDRAACERLLRLWFDTFDGAAEWIYYAQDWGMRHGWAMPTLFGREIRLPPEDNEDGLRRKSVNYPILGSDGEILKRSLVMCDREGLGPPLMAIQVYDSISWDGDVKDELPLEKLENIAGFRIPFEVKQTYRWE